MPELPEVEVIRRRLAQTVLQRRIAKVHVSSANYAFITPPQKLRAKLENRCFVSIDRRGKYLVLALDDHSHLMIHLGMTGQLFSSRAISPRLVHSDARARLRQGGGAFSPDRHTHLTITFTDQLDALHFRDCRKFGKLLWMKPGSSDPRLDRLGPDAASIEPSQLATAITGRRLPIKSALLDQAVLAGVGNIYADESLFAARIAPTRAAGDLNLEEVKTLCRAIRATLKRAIALGGSSIDDFVHPDGSDGGFQLKFAVYGRTGLPCRHCGHPIHRCVIGQRGTHFCAMCQR